MHSAAVTSGVRRTSVRKAGIAAAFALLYAGVGAPIALDRSLPAELIAPSLLLAAGLVLLSAIDCLSLRLPDVLTLALLFAGLALAWLQSSETFSWYAASAALGGLSLYAAGLFYRHYRGRDGLGLGDCKLFAAAGAWVGAEGFASVLLIACASALLVVLAWRLKDKSVDSQAVLAFGPFIAIGLWVVWLYGPLV